MEKERQTAILAAASTKEAVEQLIGSNESEMVAFRRDLHRYPELPWEEVETTNKIAKALDRINIPYRRTEPTGLIADLKGGKPGKTVALRADMDALPVQELTDGLEYKSLTDGKMHACGHDSHTSMLLTAASALAAVRDDITGTVRFIFQPAEEIGEGARALVKQGAVEGADNVFGIHIWSGLPTGTVSCPIGPAFAATDIVKISFKGKGGHGAMPQTAIDAAVVASSFVMNIQSVIAREIDPQNPAVLTIGRMDVGTRFNVIAENAVLDGTVRTFDEETRNRIEALIAHYAKSVAVIYGATSEVSYIRGTSAVDNEPNSSLLVQKVVNETFGAEKVVNGQPTMVGEDFSAYLLQTKGCFALVGSANPEKDTEWAHHHGRFNIDEDAMKVGATLYANYALAYLNQEAF